MRLNSKVIDINMKNIIKNRKAYNIQKVSSSLAEVRWIKFGIAQELTVLFTSWEIAKNIERYIKDLLPLYPFRTIVTFIFDQL